jgi:hypothetical protein
MKNDRLLGGAGILESTQALTRIQLTTRKSAYFQAFQWS